MMVIKDGRIALIGDSYDEFEGRRRIDLNGAAVLPGIIDSHVHVRELGMDAVKADLVGVKNTADIVARLKAFGKPARLWRIL